MRTRVRALVEQLAREHQQELAAAGTFVDLEELTAGIGDERLAERDATVQRFQEMDLPKRQIGSTIKQINRRVKGTEKFWSQSTSEAVLQLRADYLSDSAPLDSFWLRHQARQTGANAYKQAT